MKSKIWIDDMSGADKALAFKAVQKLDSFYRKRTVDQYDCFFIRSETDVWNGSSIDYYEDSELPEITLQQLLKLAGLQEENMTFSKKDLKDGMRLINRDGITYYLLGSNLLTYNREAYLGNGAFSQATYITSYHDSLVHPSFKDLDIMKVIDRDDKVLFVREEKSETQIQFEKLQQQIADLQAQANKLKDTL